MWLQLGLAALKSMQDEKNRMNDVASNVITQKYAPWTGQRADFSNVGKQTGLSTMIGGFGSGLLQDKLDAKEQAEKLAAVEAEKDKELKEDADFYKPGQVGTPINQPATFASVAPQAATRAPAALPQGNASSFELPQFMQGQNPWLTMQPQKPEYPLMSDFHEPAKKFNPPLSAWFNKTPLGGGL